MTKIVDQGPSAIELSEDELDSISAGDAKKPAPPKPKVDVKNDYLIMKLENVVIS